MKPIRWATAAALSLISLMDIGIVTDTGHNPVALEVLALLLGLAGLAAVYGLLRRRPWGTAAALGAGFVNAAAAVGALITSADGAIIGLTVSALALILSAITYYTEPARRPQAAAS